MISIQSVPDSQPLQTGSMLGHTAKIDTFSSFSPPRPALGAQQLVSNRAFVKPFFNRAWTPERSIPGCAGGTLESLDPAMPHLTRRYSAKDPKRPAFGHQREAEARCGRIQASQFHFNSRLHNKSLQVKPVLQSSLFCCGCLGSPPFFRAGGVPLSDFDLSGWRLFSPAVEAIPRLGACQFLYVPSRSTSRTLFIPSLTVTPNHSNCAERSINHAIIATRSPYCSESARVVEAMFRAGTSSFIAATSAAAWLAGGQFSRSRGSTGSYFRRALLRKRLRVPGRFEWTR